MSYSYKVNKRKFRTKDGVEHVKYYACAKRDKLVSSKELAQEISQRCSLTAGDIYGSLSALSDVIKNHLLHSHLPVHRAEYRRALWKPNDKLTFHRLHYTKNKDNHYNAFLFLL